MQKVRALKTTRIADLNSPEQVPLYMDRVYTIGETIPEWAAKTAIELGFAVVEVVEEKVDHSVIEDKSIDPVSEDKENAETQEQTETETTKVKAKRKKRK